MPSVLAFSALYDYVEDEKMPKEIRIKIRQILEHYFPGNDFNYEIKTWDVLLRNKHACEYILIAFSRWRNKYFSGITNNQINKIEKMEKNIHDKYPDLCV